MFSRFIALFPLAALVAVVAATNTCDGGSVKCCNQEFKNPMDFKKDPSIIGALVGLGVNAGINCSPITVIGALSDGTKCTKQTACCKDVQQIGLVNVQCTPIAVLV